MIYTYAYLILALLALHYGADYALFPIAHSLDRQSRTWYGRVTIPTVIIARRGWVSLGAIFISVFLIPYIARGVRFVTHPRLSSSISAAWDQTSSMVRLSVSIEP